MHKKEEDEMSMFCYQCEQTAKGTGCTVSGVCGKDPRTAALQDLLLHACSGMSTYAHRAGELGVRDHEIDVFTLEAVFATLTNVNFDPARFETFLRRAAELRDKAKGLYEEACQKASKEPETLDGPAAWTPASDLDGLVKQGEDVTIQKRIDSLGADVTGLQELITYGLKGLAAYADHAQILGQQDDEVYAFVHDTLNYLASNPTDVGDLTARALKVGEVNL